MIKSGLKKYPIGDLTGAFADGAVLFPLLAALALQTGMNGAVLMATAGAAYISAGVIFRVPMSVQPLKSVVVAALAMGASAAEVGWSGFVVGVACLALSFCGANRLSALVPRHLVHGLQLALGIMLMTKGVQGGISGVDAMAGTDAGPHPLPLARGQVARFLFPHRGRSAGRHCLPWRGRLLETGAVL